MSTSPMTGRQVAILSLIGFLCCAASAKPSTPTSTRASATIDRSLESTREQAPGGAVPSELSKQVVLGDAAAVKERMASIDRLIRESTAQRDEILTRLDPGSIPPNARAQGAIPEIRKMHELDVEIGSLSVARAYLEALDKTLRGAARTQPYYIASVKLPFAPDKGYFAFVQLQCVDFPPFDEGISKAAATQRLTEWKKWSERFRRALDNRPTGSLWATSELAKEMDELRASIDSEKWSEAQAKVDVHWNRVRSYIVGEDPPSAPPPPGIPGSPLPPK